MTCKVPSNPGCGGCLPGGWGLRGGHILPGDTQSVPSEAPARGCSLGFLGCGYALLPAPHQTTILSYSCLVLGLSWKVLGTRVPLAGRRFEGRAARPCAGSSPPATPRCPSQGRLLLRCFETFSRQEERSCPDWLPVPTAERRLLRRGLPAHRHGHQAPPKRQSEEGGRGLSRGPPGPAAGQRGGGRPGLQPQQVGPGPGGAPPWAAQGCLRGRRARAGPLPIERAGLPRQ